MVDYTRYHNLYKPKLKERSRALRKNSTLSEVLLWQKLRGKQLLNYKFLRQHPINNYILDFYCPELKLAIEVDGFSHNFKVDYDKKRDEELKQFGLTIVHLFDENVKKDVNNAIQVIVDCIGDLAASHPPTLPRGRNCKPVATHLSPDNTNSPLEGGSRGV